MAALGPFEPAPHLALAVSGGPDSTALALLARDWASRRRGDVLALIVDHRLRPESTDEAMRVAERLAAARIPGEVLTWRRAPGDAASQAAAREARYGLLTAACRRHRRLHLLLGHSRDDQAETVQLRRDRNSGRDGLAGMAALRETHDVRLLRPLLDQPKAALIAVCAAHGLAWEDDPGNRAGRYARAALRQPDGSPDQTDSPGLLALAQAAAHDRIARERAVAELLLDAARLHPEGWLELDRAILAAAPADIAAALLGRAVRCIGGTPYAPRRAARDRLLAALTERSSGFAGRTLGGCRLLPRARGRLLLCREPAAAECRPAHAFDADPSLRWDRRFQVRLDLPSETLADATLGPLALAPDALALPEPWAALPPAVRAGLPVLWRAAQPPLLPALSPEPPEPRGFAVAFAPAEPLAPTPFFSAGADGRLSMDPAALSR